MLYLILRWTAATALRWLYRDVHVEGRSHVPARGPLLIAANHPNQLIDVLLVATALERRVLFTGKAVLLDNPFVAALFRVVGFVPLRRASDERAAAAAARASAGSGGEVPHPERNADAFQAITDALAAGGAVLVFPEGISHNAPQIAPLKTGIARAALQAIADPRVQRLAVLPVGLTFERKWEPRSRALVQIGAPLDVGAWIAARGDAAGHYDAGRRSDALGASALVAALTREVDERLRAVTLNFDSMREAEEAMAVSALVSEVLAGGVRPLAAPDAALTSVAGVARRAAAVQRRLAALGAGDQSCVDRPRVERFLVRLDTFRHDLAAAGIPATELHVDTALAPGLWFAVREAAVVLALGPVAWWGRVNHWLPLRLTTAVARRTSRTPEDPAMHTLVTGLALVLAFYVLQTALVCAAAGPAWGALYLLSLPLAARCDFRFRERMQRAAARVRSYRRFRRDPALQARLAGEARWLRDEALAIDALPGALAPAQGT